MSNNQETITIQEVITTIEKNGLAGFPVDFTKAARKARNNPKVTYRDFMVSKQSGKLVKVKVTFTSTLTTSSMKPSDQRKGITDIQFRESSGSLGVGICKLYGEIIEPLLTEALASKKIVVNRSQPTKICSVVQSYLLNGEALEDKIIRVKLDFHKDGEKKGLPMFAIKKFAMVKGKVQEVNVICNEENIHHLFKCGTSVAGVINMDSIVTSPQGFSVPCKAVTLYIKPAVIQSVKAETFMSEDEMKDMCSDEPTEEEVEEVKEAGDADVEDDDDKVDDEFEVEETTDSTDDQLKALKALAIDEDE
jgi:hypothetical protein